MPTKKNVVRVCALADLHLRTRTFTRRVHLDGDAEFGLKAAAESIAKHKPDLVILAGDILNGRAMEQPCGAWLRAFVDKVSPAGGVWAPSGTEILAIHGNHDRSDQLAAESYGIVNLDNYDGFKRAGLLVCGLPFDPSPERFHEKLASVPPCDILVLHQMLGELCGGASSHDLTVEDIPAHVRCCVIGHVHKGWVGRNKAGTVVISPGATAHTDLGGMLDCAPSYAEIDIEPGQGGLCEAHIVELPGRMAVRVSLTGDALEDGLVIGSLKTLRVSTPLKPAVIVDRNPAAPRLDPALYPELILIDRPITATGAATADTLEDAADTIQEAVALHAPDPGDEAFRRFLLDLIEAGPKGARAVAEARLTELCGPDWAVNR